ncbi:MAG: hypothetical protein EON55_19220, partial [Alphaproteobacteria bacterium]
PRNARDAAADGEHQQLVEARVVAQQLRPGLVLAGVAGCLFTNWGGFISPTAFSLTTSAQILIYVLVGGLGTLLGPILGAVAIQYLITLLGAQALVNANLVLGVILVVFVLLVPQGIVPVVRDVAVQLFRRRDATPDGIVAEAKP